MNKTLQGLFVAGFICAGPVWCGTGSYFDNPGGAPDEIHLSVNLEFLEPGQQLPKPQEWEPLFTAASRLLFDATEGQVKISKVTFFKNCDEMKDHADVRIDVGQAGAHTFPAGLGNEGYAIFLSQLHKSVSDQVRGHFGLVHELGHYAFGLLDEYKAKSGTASASCIKESPAGVSRSASIMDGGTTIEIKNGRTEFCFASTHNRGATQQDTRRMIGNVEFEDADGWHWLAAFVKDRYHAILKPPLAEPQTNQDGFGDPPDFQVGSCALRAAVGVDSSASMSASPAARELDTAGAAQPVLPMAEGGAIEAVKEGADTFIRLLKGNDIAGIVEGGEQVGESLPRTMNADNKFQLLAEVSNTKASGSIGWPELLRRSFEQIAGKADQQSEATTAAGNEFIVLFSDGVQKSGNAEPEVSESLIPAVKRRGVAVYAVGVANADAAGLRSAATETGGNYLFARTAAEVNAAAMTFLAEIKSQGIIEAREGKILAGETITFKAHVEPATNDIQALLTWSGREKDLQMQLTDPEGVPVAPGQDDGVLIDGRERRMTRYWVAKPASGDWEISITNPGSRDRGFAFQMHASASEVTLAAHAENDVVLLPAPLVLKAVVAADRPVSGAKIVAQIERPDRTLVTLPLFDDGTFDHRDERANDGAYSNVFEDYQGSGSYNVEVSVDSEGATTVPPDEETQEESEPRLVPRFVRKARFSVVVQE